MPRLSLSSVPLSLLLIAACDDALVDSSSPTQEQELQPFVPGECGSWSPPAATPAGTLPPEQPCPDGGPCPVFTEVAEAAGLSTVQFVDTNPIDLDCVFARETLSGTLNPREDCVPQWMTGGVSVADVDEDGWPDVLMTRLGAPDHLFLNQRDGTFVDVAAEVGLGECSWTNGSVFGDVDNDGDLDLLLTTLGDTAHQLWINQLAETGELGFTNEAEARGFALETTNLHAGESVTLGDIDRDGWLDVHVNEWIRFVHQGDPDGPDYAKHGSRLLRNLGGGVFEDQTDRYGVNLDTTHPQGVFAFSSSFVDLDDDGWQDLAVTVDFGGSRLFWNAGGKAYEDGTAVAGVNQEGNAMGSTFGDLDGDGALDWFVTAIAEPGVCDFEEAPPCWTEVETGNRLYTYAGAREFAEQTDVAGVRNGGWAWGTTMFDLDNDGDLDLTLGNGWQSRDSYGDFSHVETPTRLWINDGTGVMSEEAEARGLFDRGLGRGLLSFDYDRDGDLDVLLVNHAGSPRLFRNDGGNHNAWLRVEVEGTVSNRDGRGAKVRVQAEPDGPWQVREVGVGSHFLGEGELIQHFGLGDLARVHRVEIEWPASGIVQVFDEVSSRQTLRVVEAGI